MTPYGKMKLGSPSLGKLELSEQGHKEFKRQFLYCVDIGLGKEFEYAKHIGELESGKHFIVLCGTGWNPENNKREWIDAPIAVHPELFKVFIKEK